jgi:polar amino acid transport system permease protein
MKTSTEEGRLAGTSVPGASPAPMSPARLRRAAISDVWMGAVEFAAGPAYGARRAVKIAIGTGLLLVVLAAGWEGLKSLGTKSTASSYQWDFNVVGQYLPVLLRGLVYTLEITGLGIGFSLILGTLVAMCRLAKFLPLRVAVTGYIEIMRGTPMLVQLVWFYYALPIITGIQLPAFEAVVLAFSLNGGAFYGEAIRSGIQAVAKEQVETASILGLSYVQRMRYVIAPQAFRTVLPVLISLSISLFKDTSLVSTLGLADLMYNGQSVATATYRPLEIFTTVAFLYFAVALPVTLLLRRLEIHLSRHAA